MNERTSTVLSRKPCGWCCGTSVLNAGAGYFRDFDCDLSYGVGVCGGCGGLGYTVDDPEFQSNAKRIMELRFAYCPTSEKEIGPGGSFPPSALHSRLLALKTAIVELYTKYGPHTDEERAMDRSFARGIVNGRLDTALSGLQEEMSSEAARFRKITEQHPEKARAIEAIALCAEGKLDEAEALLKRLADERPDVSIIHHDIGALYLVYRRDPDGALPHLLRSTQLLPAKTLHFAQAIRVLLHLDRLPEAVEIATRAKHCPDFDRASDEGRRLIEDLAQPN